MKNGRESVTHVPGRLLPMFPVAHSNSRLGSLSSEPSFGLAVLMEDGENTYSILNDDEEDGIREDTHECPAHTLI